jgi:hypothetical protein
MSDASRMMWWVRSPNRPAGIPLWKHSCPLGGPSDGHVYLIEDLEREGVFKVGQAGNVAKRVIELSYTRRIRFVWYLVTNQGTWLERYIMCQWADRWVEGEWFRPDADQVSAFTSLVAVNWKPYRPTDLEPCRRRLDYNARQKPGNWSRRPVVAGEPVTPVPLGMSPCDLLPPAPRRARR